MSQLSGGQASIVALSLIFAIQRCDPAPFYVFDEVDPALDDVHRRAVAQLISASSMPREIQRVDGDQLVTETSQAQFIMTTHRPELIEIADKHYKIAFSDRNSFISAIDRDVALDLVRPSSLESTDE